MSNEKDAYKIIDFEKKGNVVRLYLGNSNCNDYWGDDWNDAPYEHNAGLVYPKYIKKICDISFPFDYNVLEPCDGDWNSPWSKKDIRDRKTPCLIAVPIEVISKGNYCSEYSYREFVGYNENIMKIYFDDSVQRFFDGYYKEFDYTAVLRDFKED